jgi:lysophospholipase L1-like esterase
MADVVLLGDSIRMGYQATAIGALEGIATVWSPVENGGDSRRLLSHVEDWIVAQAPRVVHLNAGLHDLKREFGTGAQQVPLPEYEENLRALFSRLRREPELVILWAATTPTNEEWHRQNKPFDRLAVDVAAYNASARRIADEFAIPVNDLHQVITSYGRDQLLSRDGVHFTPAGYTLLGQTVAAFIQRHLPR